MKILIQTLYILFFFTGCRTLPMDNNFYGEYYNKGKDYEYRLILQQDPNTFKLELKYQDTNPKCIGRWKLEGEKIIHLQCEEVSELSKILSNGYMNERDYKLEIISNKKLKFKKVVLTKVK